MRNILFFLALLTTLVACDDGSSSSTTTNNNHSVPRLLSTEPPLTVPDEPQVSPAFGRDFDARLSTPRPLFEETEAPVAPTPAPAEEDVSAEPTATTSLFGTPFPTRGGFPTSTPYQ